MTQTPEAQAIRSVIQTGTKAYVARAAAGAAATLAASVGAPVAVAAVAPVAAAAAAVWAVSSLWDAVFD